jgi:hypothetical protein
MKLDQESECDEEEDGLNFFTSFAFVLGILGSLGESVKRRELCQTYFYNPHRSGSGKRVRCGMNEFIIPRY